MEKKSWFSCSPGHCCSDIDQLKSWPTVFFGYICTYICTNSLVNQAKHTNTDTEDNISSRESQWEKNGISCNIFMEFELLPWCSPTLWNIIQLKGEKKLLKLYTWFAWRQRGINTLPCTWSKVNAREGYFCFLRAVLTLSWVLFFFQEHIMALK